jgi:DNA-binding NtrC family response regulator
MLIVNEPLLAETDIDIDGVAPAASIESDDSFRSAKLRAVSSFERAYLERMLSAHGGNIQRAADASKKVRRAFFELMSKYDIQSHRFRGAMPQ